MSPEEVRACFRLYAAFRMRKIGPFGRMLATLTARRRRRPAWVCHNNSSSWSRHLKFAI
jgi:hypothetical protein